MDKMIHEIEKLKPNSVEKLETPSKVSAPTRHGKQYVVAIDFGTTYSGYAYQHMSDHVRYPAGGYTQMWQGSNGLSEKTSTSLLLTKDGTFEAFGYEAETRYSELLENNEEEGWKFFKHFKMKIFQEKDLNRDFKIEDDHGTPMPAGIVFGLSIEFLKQRAFKHIKESDPNMMEENIFYVITIPAIWCENSRQFMRDAIRIAGIDDDQAILAKEPEVAAVYCKEIQLDVQQANKRIGRQNHVFNFEQGSKFVVLDLGGGTTDIAVQEVIDDGRMKILRSASGGPWGGMTPDKEFEHIIREVIGMGNNTKFLERNMGGFYELLQTWEFKKRVSSDEITSSINISVPPEIMENISIPKEEEIVTSKGNVRVLRGKIKIYFETLKSLFNETVQNIVDHLKRMAEEGTFEDANVMFMVGGFSSSRFIQEAVRDAFPDMTIIVPKNPVLAVLLGAVAHGFQPNTIDARVSSSHYGIEENGRFVQLINKGQEIPIGVIVSTYKTRLVSGKDGFHLKIFASENNIPPRRIGQCRSIGEIFIRMYRAHGKIEKEIEIAIYFDLTEMKVQATDVQTQRNFITSCNFLN
ncbi:hypothetical protein FSP39_003589 [Pinctada imbricata]|uniref:Heat shock 70 kDa protein n=1 Tax=Pinctada imbricata TaxID=66713 RepID=A0AA88YCR6_PINIB|nr:hypothetical protein FSP39_003589 [Pinctada imbricata]